MEIMTLLLAVCLKRPVSVASKQAHSLSSCQDGVTALNAVPNVIDLEDGGGREDSSAGTVQSMLWLGWLA